MQHFKELLSPRTKLVSLVHVSNTLGAVLDASYVVEEAKKVGCGRAGEIAAQDTQSSTCWSADNRDQLTILPWRCPAFTLMWRAAECSTGCVMFSGRGARAAGLLPVHPPPGAERAAPGRRLGRGQFTQDVWAVWCGLPVGQAGAAGADAPMDGWRRDDQGGRTTGQGATGSIPYDKVLIGTPKHSSASAQTGTACCPLGKAQVLCEMR